MPKFPKEYAFLLSPKSKYWFRNIKKYSYKKSCVIISCFTGNLKGREHSENDAGSIVGIVGLQENYNVVL